MILVWCCRQRKVNCSSWLPGRAVLLPRLLVPGTGSGLCQLNCWMQTNVCSETFQHTHAPATRRVATAQHTGDARPAGLHAANLPSSSFPGTLSACLSIRVSLCLCGFGVGLFSFLVSLFLFLGLSFCFYRSLWTSSLSDTRGTLCSGSESL